MKTGPKPRTLEQTMKMLFEKAVRKEDCLLIEDGYPNGMGYRIVRAGGKDWYAHRLSYHMNVGEIKEGDVVRHSCDTPNCIEPAHLFVGTHGDNVDDKIRKKRHMHGESHYASKLTWEQVREIRAAPRMKLQLLSDKYGVGRGTISQILKHQIWKE